MLLQMELIFLMYLDFLYPEKNAKSLVLCLTHIYLSCGNLFILCKQKFYFSLNFLAINQMFFHPSCIGNVRLGTKCANTFNYSTTFLHSEIIPNKFSLSSHLQFEWKKITL